MTDVKNAFEELKSIANELESNSNLSLDEIDELLVRAEAAYRTAKNRIAVSQSRLATLLE